MISGSASIRSYSRLNSGVLVALVLTASSAVAATSPAPAATDQAGIAATSADLTQTASEDKAPEAAKGRVRYKAGQDVNFEKLLIQGQLRKPTVTVVTGSVQQGGDGLLRIRKEFMDRVAADFGEEAP